MRHLSARNRPWRTGKGPRRKRARVPATSGSSPLPTLPLLFVVASAACLAYTAVVLDRGESTAAGAAPAGGAWERMRRALDGCGRTLRRRTAGAAAEVAARAKQLFATLGWLRAPNVQFTSPHDTGIVVWAAESALDCAQRHCFVRSNWTQAVLRLDRLKAARFEKAVADASAPGGLWPTRLDAVDLMTVFKNSSCTVVGRSPYAGSALARSREIDHSDVTIRVNLALPFSRRASGQRALPGAGGRVEAAIGLGTRTEVIVLNWIALKAARCFADLSNPELDRHLRNVILIAMLHDAGHVDLFLRCRAQLERRGRSVFLYALHPMLRLGDTLLLQSTMEGMTDEERRVAFPGARTAASIPFPTTGTD
jgi:hypothetical protein